MDADSADVRTTAERDEHPVQVARRTSVAQALEDRIENRELWSLEVCRPRTREAREAAINRQVGRRALEAEVVDRSRPHTAGARDSHEPRRVCRRGIVHDDQARPSPSDGGREIPVHRPPHRRRGAGRGLRSTQHDVRRDPEHAHD
jgi:hypothetical protein